MKERPILFSAPMVRSLLNCTKSQTRRVVKRMPFYDAPSNRWIVRGVGQFNTERDAMDVFPLTSPYGQPGDRLWVREAFAIVPRTAYRCSEGVQQTLNPNDPYEHDAAIYQEGWTRSKGGFRWRPSIHMPRWASRILLEIVSVRVERLQDISAEDAIAEGISIPITHGFTDINVFRAIYRDLWKSINGPESWESNPWVWCISFKRIEP